MGLGIAPAPLGKLIRLCDMPSPLGTLLPSLPWDAAKGVLPSLSGGAGAGSAARASAAPREVGVSYERGTPAAEAGEVRSITPPSMLRPESFGADGARGLPDIPTSFDHFDGGDPSESGGAAGQAEAMEVEGQGAGGGSVPIEGVSVSRAGGAGGAASAEGGLASESLAALPNWCCTGVPRS